MKKLLLLAAIILIAGCDSTTYDLSKPDLDRSLSLCSANGGIRKVAVGFRAYVVDCNNDARFIQQKTS
jgi:uncharacterized lipoprotein YajG